MENISIPPLPSSVINTKLLILCHGLDCDFESIKKDFPELTEDYKVNQIRVSDRHFLPVNDENRLFLPDELILNSSHHSSVVKVYFQKDSPLLLVAEKKKFRIKFKKENIKIPIKVKAVKLPNYAKLTYKSVALSEFVTVIGKDRIGVLPFEGCEHWVIGAPCKFCGANPQRLEFRKYKPDVYNIKKRFNSDYKRWWSEKSEFILKGTEEGVKQLVKLDNLRPHTHIFVLSGGLLDTNFLWKICLQISEIINKYIDLSKVDSYINLTPPKNFTFIDLSKAIGFRSACFNLEVFGQNVFSDTCPGKEKIFGYKKARKALEYAVEVFGAGNARSNFVLGAQPINKLKEGVLCLAKRGIVSDYTVFFPRPGSIWNNKNTPSPDEVLDFTQYLIEIYKRFDFKPFCCPLSSRSSIASDLLEIDQLR